MALVVYDWKWTLLFYKLVGKEYLTNPLTYDIIQPSNIGGVITTRLWHYALIKYLPRQQLLSQWRECVCIAKSIHNKGTPNHILVNKIMDYPISEFNDYCNIVLVEMVKRGYNVSESSINKLEEYIGFEVDSDKQYSHPFKGWHNLRYLEQCYYNLQEKYDCGGLTDKEWETVANGCLKIQIEWTV